MKKGLLILLSSALVLAGCSSQEKADEHDHLHDSNVGGPTSSVKDAERTPYGGKWVYLDKATPEEVALAGVNVVATANASQSTEDIIADLNGLLSVQGLIALEKEPWIILPEITGPMTEAWIDAGGQATAETTISAETHPADTTTTWVRKVDSIRLLDGIDSEVNDSWMIALSRQHETDNWRIDNLVHTTTSFTSQSPITEQEESEES